LFDNKITRITEAISKCSGGDDYEKNLLDVRGYCLCFYGLSNTAGENKIVFQMDLANGTMNVTADYARNRVDGNDFFLNRDFTVTRLHVDGKNVNPADITEQVTLALFDNYAVNIYRLPVFENSVHVEYRGILSGKDGISPYMTETISPDFTFRRWETVCYPLFASAENFRAKLTDDFALTMSVEVPKEYVAQFSGSNTTETETGESTIVLLLVNN
jgi:hypothetical protein